MPTQGRCLPRDEDRVVGAILREFGLRPPPSLAWRRRLADLARVLRLDYDEIIAGHVLAGRLPLADIEREARAVFPAFNREPLSFRENVARIRDPDRGLGVRVRFSPYGHRGHPLRGFCSMDEDKTVIWVNERHTPTAIAATLAHEVGHVLWHRLHRTAEQRDVHLFYNADYSGHLADPGELFADIFASLAAYPREAARRLFGRRGWPRSLRELEERARATVGEVYAYLQEYHGADDLRGTSRLPAPRRFAYITSMVHFCRVRAAVLHTVGV